MGLITGGVVDERSIVDVSPDDLVGFDRHHFFSGIAGWEEALRVAGWPEDRPVWTGSAPCQSFSVAGKGKGKDDERHLWPEFYRLIRECRPPVIFGEQVEGAVKHGWACDVKQQLEVIGYETVFAIIPAAAIGAPHIRSRLYWGAINKEMLEVQGNKTSGRIFARTESQGRQEIFMQNLRKTAPSRISREKQGKK